MLRLCSGLGNNQFETREKDFFFRRGGYGAWRTRGSGGGGGRVFSLLAWVALKAADASVKDFILVGM